MTNYDPPYKTLFFVCCSTVAAIVASETGLFGTPDTYLAKLSHQELVEEYERYLADHEEHPWCGFGRMDAVEVGYLVPDGDDGVRFIDEQEYESLMDKTGEIL